MAQYIILKYLKLHYKLKGSIKLNGEALVIFSIRQKNQKKPPVVPFSIKLNYSTNSEQTKVSELGITQRKQLCCT